MAKLSESPEELDKKKKLLQAEWDAWVSTYPDPFTSVGRRFDEHELLTMASDIAEKLDLQDCHALLDVGCGSGVLLDQIVRLRKISAARGIDISKEHIRNAKKNFPNLDFRVGEMDHIPFESNSFERILCYGVFLYTRDWEKTINEFLRVCKPGGKILIGDIPCKHLKGAYYRTQLISAFKSLFNWQRARNFFKYQKKCSAWRWTNLKDVLEYLDSLDLKSRVFKQPKNLQFGCVTHSYRRDLLILTKA